MLNLRDKVILCLHNLGYSQNKMLTIYEIFDGFENVIPKLQEYKHLVVDALGIQTYNNLQQFVTEEKVDELYNDLLKKQIEVITIYDEDYPYDLRHIKAPPMVLYYRGDIKLLTTEKILAIVGTRKPSSYGKDMTTKFTEDIVKNDVVTLSGLAYGVDTIVAKKTLELGGKHIAVLGNGIDEIYPESNANLAKQILEQGGLIITQFKPGEEPTQFNFPERNRVISGMSTGVLITEAGEKSGSIITANCTSEDGKPLYILPVNLTSKPSLGNLRLLREYPHAVCVCSEDILYGIGAMRLSETLNYGSESLANNNLQLTIEQHLVYDVLLEEGEASFDDLVMQTQMDARELTGLLTEMEMLGIIKNISGNIYSLK